MKKKVTKGIHHVTAIVKDAQKNVHFYAKVLGMKLVKQTVNFDKPNTYHLYYGDHIGTPGTILTFFPWPHMPEGQRGYGQAVSFSLSIPMSALTYWRERLANEGVVYEGPYYRKNEAFIRFSDPDGIQLELIALSSVDHLPVPQVDSTVPKHYAIRGIHRVTICEKNKEETATFLKHFLGYELADYIELIYEQDVPAGKEGYGTIHHIAFRADNEQDLIDWKRYLEEHGLKVTEVRDRKYFKSIYFREPGGTLFEIATDSPGFTVDEKEEELGNHLMLPPWLEGNRERIVSILKPLK